MGVKTYMGVPGFAVEAHSLEDVYEALDRLHTQICDEIERVEGALKQSTQMEPDKLKKLNYTSRVLEDAMESLSWETGN